MAESMEPTQPTQVDDDPVESPSADPNDHLVGPICHSSFLAHSASSGDFSSHGTDCLVSLIVSLFIDTNQLLTTDAHRVLAAEP